MDGVNPRRAWVRTSPPTRCPQARLLEPYWQCLPSLRSPSPSPSCAVGDTDGGSKKEAYATLHANIDKLQAATKIFSSRLDAGISAHPPQRGRSAPSR